MNNLKAITFICTFAVLGLSTQINAATSQSATSINGFSLNNSSMGFKLSNKSARNVNKKIDGVFNSLEASMGYKINDSLSAALYNEVSYKSQKNADSVSRWENLELAFTKSFYVPGINFSSTAGYAYATNKDVRNSGLYNGKAYAKVNASRSFSDMFSVNSQLKTSQFARRSGKSGTTTNITSIELTPFFNISDNLKFQVAFATDFFFNKDIRNAGYMGTFITPKFMYNLSKRVSFELYADMKPFVSYDDKTIAKNFEDEITYGVSTSVVAF